jgi:gamma-butyrobetaine dioxygenase
MTASTRSSESRTTWTDGANLAGAGIIDPLPARRPFTAANSLSVHVRPEDPAATAAVARDVIRWGAAVVTDLGSAPTAAATLGERLATPASVHTGCTFSLRASASPTHLGETLSSIEPHTDFAYRQHPPTLQVLHSIRPARIGGLSTLVDGLAVIERLDDATVDVLATVPVEFAAISTTVHFHSRRPVFELVGGNMRSIAYNRLKLVGAMGLELRNALQRFDRVLRDPALELQLALGSGDAIVFDNRRVLHGRTPFDDPRRHLEGWLGNIDDLESLVRLANAATLPQPSP